MRTCSRRPSASIRELARVRTSISNIVVRSARCEVPPTIRLRATDKTEVNAPSLLAVMLVGWAFATRSGSVLAGLWQRFLPSAAVARLAAGALVPLYAMQLTLVLLDSRLQSDGSRYAWMKTLPLPVFDDRVPHQPLFASLGLGLGFMETAALALVVLSLRQNGRTLTKRWVACIAIALALLSVVWPVMSTTDPYEYAATGMLGMHAYAPASGAFDGTVYESIQRVVPLRGVIYGPLWVVFDVLQTAWLPSLYWKLEALRFTNASLVAVSLGFFWRAGLSRAALAGFALNPFLWCYCVQTPHAEIEGVTLLAAAYALLRSSKTWPAFCLIVAAGLVKLPFVIVGGALLVAITGASRRLSMWVAAIALAFAVSYLVPGPAYLAVLSKFAVHRTAGPWYAGWLATASFIALAMFAVVTFRRRVFGAAWLFQQMSPLAAPWYLLWGIPYALATGSIESYLISLPLAGAVLDQYTRHETGLLFVVLLVATALAVDVYVTRSRRIRAAAAAA